jgi:hypothetical protein
VDRLLLVGWKIKDEHRSGLAKQGQEVNEPRQKGPGRIPKKWMCVLTLRTGAVGNNTNLKVMFNRRRHNHSAFHFREGWTAGMRGHEVAVLRGQGARVQQLRVRSASDRLDGPYAADQGQFGELYCFLRGLGGSSGGQYGIPGYDQEGSEGVPIGKSGGHGHREGQPRWQPQPVRKQPGSDIILMKMEFAPRFIVK